MTVGKNRHAISDVRCECVGEVAGDGIGLVSIEDEFEQPHGDDVLAIVDILDAVEEVSDGYLNDGGVTLIAMMATVKKTMNRRYSV